ncbi:MAG: Asp-tRNA(Asn)/Glu-tRNA(Gln) amidotransferase subunit GatC [Ruminococcus sp.]|nr:Asp-tRNA(Asn)/Glu-tRNA(Gln) amidotransferase subunit GatC [Ruminococcus sp.]MDD6097195.1 Asp-tRNA(Asn)/Glu-tRNA(Gln) amidotransferase subunit GatC [Oscillospiraceae bacterium]
MSIDIRHIAKLSRLRIEDEKLAKFEKDMEAIVAMVDRLPDIEEELTLDAGDAMPLRKDEAVPNKFTRDELIANAPEVQAGCLVVPKTVE